MKKVVRKTCRHCREKFECKPQAAKVQKYCPKKECQQARQRKKYRRWLTQPAHAAVHRDALRAWARAHPEYWRQYRRTHREYRERERLRMRGVRRMPGSVAKQTDWRQIAVERLDAIEAIGTPRCVAKQTDSARRMSAVLGYLRWTVEDERVAKQTGIAWAGGTAG